MIYEKQAIFSLTDLTSLSESDTDECIIALCQKAVRPNNHAAAICVYPQFVKTAIKALQSNSVKIATVVNFPQGLDALADTLEAIRNVIRDGVDEIDVVFPYEQFLKGDRAGAKEFIRQCKVACGKSVLLKVILETGALLKTALIASAAQDVIDVGADFIKTSTGKIKIGATLEAAEVILRIIKNAQRQVGFKVSGGVRTVEQAEQYIALANQILGPNWVSPHTFRIGTSQLLG